MARPNPGSGLCSRKRAAGAAMEVKASVTTNSAGLIDLIEHPAVREEPRMGRLPSAEVLDGHQVQLGELAGIARRYSGAARPIVPLGRQVLRRVGIEEV